MRLDLTAVMLGIAASGASAAFCKFYDSSVRRYYVEAAGVDVISVSLPALSLQLLARRAAASTDHVCSF